MPIRYSKRGRKQIWRRESSCSSIYGNLNSTTFPLYMVLRTSPCGNPFCITTKFEILSFFPDSEHVTSTFLHKEKAILLGRAGRYSEALQMLVQGHDTEAAEAFCLRAAQGRDSQFRQTLFLTLLQIYLNSKDLIRATVDLLSNNPGVFTAKQVIRLLPDSWSVQLVSKFLFGSFRETLHRRRMTALQKALTQAELMRHKGMWVSRTACFTSFALFQWTLRVSLPCFSEGCFPSCLSSTDAGLENKAQTEQGTGVWCLPERVYRTTISLSPRWHDALRLCWIIKILFGIFSHKSVYSLVCSTCLPPSFLISVDLNASSQQTPKSIHEKLTFLN